MSIGHRLALLMLIVVPVVWAYLRPPRWRGRCVRGERVIFPTSALLQIAGVFVSYAFAVGLFFGVTAHPRMKPQVICLMALFFLAGTSVLFRQVELDRQGVTTRFLMHRKTIRWSDIQSAHCLASGSWLLLGGFHRIVLDRQYCDFELLVLGITTQLKAQQPDVQRLSFEDSCRLLQKKGLLSEGDLPAFPDRRPQHNDPANYGIKFFRTQIDHTANLSSLDLGRCLICRCEVRGTAFANSDLTQSNLCWSSFSHVDFTESLLIGADLRSSNFTQVRFVRANLRGADMRLSSFERCFFDGAIMDRAILTREQGAKLEISDQQRAKINWRDEGGREPPGG